MNSTNGSPTTFEEKNEPKTKPFGGLDLDRLRLSSANEASPTKRVLVTVPVRKPNRQEFVRVHPGDTWRIQTQTLTTADDRRVHLVEPELWDGLAGDLSPTLIVTAMTRQNVVFLWPLRLPASDGRASDWHTSAIEAANLATSSWVKVVSNMGLGAYEVHAAVGDLPEPVWPDVEFSKLLEIGFRDAYIKDADHPVLRRLRGEL